MTASHRAPWAIGFILFAILTFAFLGDRPVTRAQEARVLETARQMIDAPDWHGWLVPQLNGEERLRKPPLCYWYTAASYKVLGVNAFAGRLPTLLLAFAAIGVTGLIGRDLLGRRGGLFAAGILASSFFMIRFGRSAETDTPCVLGTALAVWGVIRGSRDRFSIATVGWMGLAGFGIGLSAMTKGGPAVYPIVFLALYALALKSWTPITRFLASGAPLLALALVAPWFLYILRDPAAAQVAEEMRVVSTGANHFGLFYEYLPILLVAILPWTGLYFVGLLSREFRSPFDAAQRTIACIIGCVALPLCVTLNVQPHYLLPMLPGCALLTAWLLDRACDASRDTSIGTQTWLKWTFAVTAVIGFVAGPGVFATGYIVRHQVGVFEIAAMLSLVAASVAVFVVLRRRSTEAQISGFILAAMVFMPITTGWWAPTLTPDSTRGVANVIRARFADRPLITFGADDDISLAFELRRVIPDANTQAQLDRLLKTHPNAIVMVSAKRTPDPAGLARLNVTVAEDPQVRFFAQP